ncbi:MAG: hypothetical protein BGN88_13755 [Clostridiales bacterium 43-6]|nr:MAG: hypothetical protein BGN88_13755 [Clostridiales bacterium 43-6]
MNYYKESVAYDYALFMPKEEKKVVQLPRQYQKQQAKVIKKAAAPKAKVLASNALGALSKVLTGAVILTIVVLLILTKVQISEVHDKIASAEKQIRVLDGETTRLNTELEKKISYKNIEQAAKELGMQKKQKTQVNYINISKEDCAEIIKAPKDDVLSTLSDAVLSVVE